MFRSEDEPFGGFRDDADVHAAVVAGAGDPDLAVRRISVEILADVAVPSTAAALVPRLADPDPAVRSAAIRGLVRAGPALDGIRPLLDDPDPGVRALAAGALLPAVEAQHVIAAMLRDPRPAWRAAAVVAPGHASREPDTVAAGLADPEPSVRRAAAQAIATVDRHTSVDSLVSALGDRDQSVRDAASRALGAIGLPAQDALVRVLSDPDLQPGALAALVAIPGPPPAALQTFARDQVELARHYHRLWLDARSGRDERMDLVAHGVRFRSLDHGIYALRAASRLGDLEAMGVAIENLASRDAQQRANALETLDAVGQPEVVRPLLPLWDAAPGPRDGPGGGDHGAPARP